MTNTVYEKYNQTYQQYPRLEAPVKMLWHSDYWDGPLSGLCLLDGNKCWFECVADYELQEDEDCLDTPWYRRFIVYKLTDEQLAYVETNHAKFQRMVGTHCDYPRGEVSYTAESFEQYYREAIESKDSRPSMLPDSDECIIGWYEE